jgi:hypothetical protein
MRAIYPLIDINPPDPRHDPQQHQVDRDRGCDQIAQPRRSGHVNEVPLQGYGHARLGRRQWQCATWLAREGVFLSCSYLRGRSTTYLTHALTVVIVDGGGRHWVHRTRHDRPSNCVIDHKREVIVFWLQKLSFFYMPIANPSDVNHAHSGVCKSEMDCPARLMAMSRQAKLHSLGHQCLYLQVMFISEMGCYGHQHFGSASRILYINM